MMKRRDYDTRRPDHSDTLDTIGGLMILIGYPAALLLILGWITGAL